MRNRPVIVHYEDRTRMPPDFVICGAPRANGGVAIFASRELTQAELNAELIEHTDIYGILAAVEPNPVDVRYVLTATTKSFVQVVAEDYVSALRRLFEEWTPPTADRVALPGT